MKIKKENIESNLKKLDFRKFIIGFAIVLTLLLGTFLRFNNLSNNPPSLNWDEVAFAYNAHSLIETGKDEYGKSFPLYFRSLDDYKLPVYVYLSAASEKVFGYDNFAVRFPSAFFGSLTVLLVLILTFLLTRNIYTSILSSFIFAILPWHIQFSRMAAEATVGLFFFLLGLILFVYSAKRRWLVPLSLIFFFISAYTYLSFRFIIPIILIVFIYLFRKYIVVKSFTFYLSIILIAFFALILLSDSYVHKSANRSTGIGAVNNLTSQYQEDIVNLVQDGKLGINIPRRVFHDSHLMSSFNIYSSGYMSIFSPTYLFFDLAQSRHYTPGIGLLYIWMLPFLLIGLFKAKKENNSRAILITLILITAIPTAIAFDNPNAIRTILLCVPFSIASAIGLVYIGVRIKDKSKILNAIYILAMTLIISFFLFYFYHQNSIHLPNSKSKEWQYGRQEMSEYLIKNMNQYNNIIVSNSLEWPNIFYLYYSKYDPAKYLREGGTKSGSWSSQENAIENIKFRQFNFLPESKKSGILFVGKPDEFPKKTNPIKIIYYLDGKPAIYFVTSIR